MASAASLAGTPNGPAAGPDRNVTKPMRIGLALFGLRDGCARRTAMSDASSARQSGKAMAHGSLLRMDVS